MLPLAEQGDLGLQFFQCRVRVVQAIFGLWGLTLNPL